MYLAILFLPLIGFLIAGLFGRAIGAKASEYVTSGLLILAALLSWVAFFGFWLGGSEAQVVHLLRWIERRRSSTLPGQSASTR
jgi:NADH-quinone oxidoreductase subunit L